jgi:Domain of unknown function (DUF4276)
MRIRPIVEGQGEVDAVPWLLRRLRDSAGLAEIEFDRPHRRHRSKLVKRVEFQDWIRFAFLDPACSAVMVVFDADDDCPKELGPEIEGWAQEAADGRPVSVVLANREYEAWLLAGSRTLRGRRSIRQDAPIHPEPEKPRDAKEQLSRMMSAGLSYSPKADQPALTTHFDLAAAHKASRSFRKLVKEFGRLATAIGAPPSDWPPREWL